MRRSSKPTLPFNPQNPYDTPIISQCPESTDSEETFPETTETESQPALPDNDTRSNISGISSAYASTMPPPSQASHGRRRQRSEASAEKIEAQAHAKRMQSMRETVMALQQRKEEAELTKKAIELRKEIETLEAWNKEQNID